MAPQRVIGVDLGGTKILAGIVDRDGTVERRREVPTPLESQDELLRGLAGAVEEVLEEDVAAIGFGIPSTIDQRSGKAVTSVNIPLADLDVRAWARERFGLPAGIDNDANAATLAEWAHGAGRGTRHMVMLTLGTGVGGGIVSDGRLYRGWAELGHVVIDYDGPPCFGACTGRGHLEAVCSGQAADRDARALLGPDATAHDLVKEARGRDERSLAAIAEIGGRLGAAIGSFANIWYPQVTVIGGGFGVAAFDLLLGPAKETLVQEALPPARDEVEIVLAELGPEAGLLGAGLVALETLDS